MNTTLKIVKGSLVPVEMHTEDLGDEFLERLNRLSKVTGVLRPELERAYNHRRLLNFLNRGLGLLVRGDVVRRFRYAAGIINNEIPNLWIGCVNETGRILYTGDIPDFALERIERVKELTTHITIHSQRPFPVKMYEKIDPVVLAWASCPQLTYQKGKWHPCEEELARYAVVVAMWDMDKESML